MPVTETIGRNPAILVNKHLLFVRQAGILLRQLTLPTVKTRL